MAAPFTTRPEIDGTFGVVASTHWLATAVGMGVLERGGNAFDAAAAAGLHPPGGRAAPERPRRRRAAHRSRRPARGNGGDLRPGPGARPAPPSPIAGGSASTSCPAPGCSPPASRAPSTPGRCSCATTAPGGSATSWRGDRLRPPRLPARPAHLGPGSPRSSDLFREHWPTSAAVYLPGGEVPDARRPVHATRRSPPPTSACSPRRRAAGGGREAEIERARTAWSQGFVAEAVDRFCRTQEVMDVSGRRHRGLLTGADMAGWRPSVEAPLVLRLRPPARVLKMRALDARARPCSSSSRCSRASTSTGSTRRGRTSSTSRSRRRSSPSPTATPSTATRLFVEVPMETLLSDAYNDERRSLIGERASLDQRPGSVPGYGKAFAIRLASDGARGRAGEPTTGRMGAADAPAAPAEDARRRFRRMGGVAGDTCHVDVIDRDGNMVSATPSGGWLQSSPVIPELGFPSGHAGPDVRARRASTRPRCSPASARARRCRPPWRSATASRTSPGARRAATSRTSGRRSSSCATSMPA